MTPTDIVGKASASIVSVQSDHVPTSGFVWRPGLIVAAAEPLAEEGDAALPVNGGRRVAATKLGRDEAADIALLQADTGDAPPIALDVATPGRLRPRLIAPLVHRPGPDRIWQGGCFVVL